MKDTDWIVAFKLNGFLPFYTTSELIQLSLICKKFRNFLSPFVFNTFNFTYFAITENYESCTHPMIKYGNNNRNYLNNPFKPFNIDLAQCKCRFKLDLKMYPNQPKKLEFHNAENYYYLLNDIPNVFTSLTAIIISNSKFQYDILQYLLDNLNYLEYVELNNSSLIQCVQSSDQTYINWPISLKKLKVHNIQIAWVTDKLNPISFSQYNIYNVPISHAPFSLKCLPKLIYFEYESFTLESGAEDLSKFLKLNPQITSLKIISNDFYPELLSNIDQDSNLKSLYLSFIYDACNLSGYNILPVFNSITSLAITLYDYSEINDKLIDKFPNLAELLVEMHSKYFDKLFDLTRKFLSISNLNLKIYLKSTNIKEFTFPSLEKLKTLEFILGRDTNLNEITWNADSCLNLKLVKFSKVKDLVHIDQPEMNPKLIDCWKVLHFPHNVVYYRNI